MKILRTAIALVGILLVVGGYFASQYAYFFGDVTAYSNALDKSGVPVVALLVLLGMIVLLVMPSEDKAS